MKMQFLARAGAALAVSLLFSLPASAQATRTWVSGVGDDVNPCSRTAPCKTFPGAISKTATGGEINAIDPGGFGAVTITKSITIDGNSAHAGILASLTTGVTINATATSVVTLRNLSINGVGNGIKGIRILSAGAVHIENCVIFGFTNQGIECAPAANCRVFIKDTIIHSCNTAGTGGALLIKPAAASTVQASLDNVRLQESLYGLKAEDRSIVTLHNCMVDGNSNNGVLALSTAGVVVVNMNNCTVVNNTNASNNAAGIQANGAQASVRISNCLVASNNNGLLLSAGGTILTSGTSPVLGNTVDGSPTPPVIQPK